MHATTSHPAMLLALGVLLFLWCSLWAYWLVRKFLFSKVTRVLLGLAIVLMAADLGLRSGDGAPLSAVSFLMGVQEEIVHLGRTLGD